MTRAPPGSTVGLIWNDEASARIKRIMMTNPRATIANIAASFRVSFSTMRAFLLEFPEAHEIVEAGRALGDNAVSDKNFALAMKGDSKALEREMKRRGMIGNDLLPVMAQEQKRDYSRLTVEELEQLALIDAKTRNTGASEGSIRKISPPLHP
jgi:hypothetical protein